MSDPALSRRLARAAAGIGAAVLASLWGAAALGASAPAIAVIGSLGVALLAVGVAALAHASRSAARDDAARAARDRERIGRSERERDALRAVFDAVDEPLLAIDAEGAVILANRAARAMLAPGTSGPEGRPVEDLLPHPELVALVSRAARGRAGREAFRLVESGGVRIFEAFGAPVRLPGQAAGVVLGLRDATEQATTMQLKTDFVANASHELRTPLASIRTALETLREYGDDDPSVRERMAHLAATNAERLEELLADLLDLSRLESPEMRASVERCAASDIARSLSPLFEEACAHRRLTLSFEFDTALEAMETDPRLITLILRNLIDNAVKFAHEGTTVRVLGTPAEAGATRAARFEVIDRGIGIPIAQQQRVFERFYQVDAARSGPRERRGTGLGLAIVKHAVRALGGSVSLRSVWMQGTTVTVDLPGCLPAHDAADAPVTTRSASPHPPGAA